jgi:hypothetical protein
MQDLRLAFRATPVVSIVAALSLALGMGANTAIFSLETREISDFRLQISDCLLIVDSISHSQNQSAINNQSEI